jgi:hypothetical protein
MKRLYMMTYRYRDITDERARQLTKSYLETGPGPGLVAQYERLDGKGGFALYEVPDEEEAAKSFELTLRYQQWMEFELIPVTTFEDAFPVIQHLYG